LSLGSLRNLAPAELPQAAGVTSFLRQLGGAIGINLVGILLEWRLAAHGLSGHGLVPPLARVPAFRECLFLLAGITFAAAAAAVFLGVRKRSATRTDPPGRGDKL